jgi:predicted secreted protein with PEFG-CTERM motif
MKGLAILALLVVTLFVSSLMGSALAQKTYDINIPTGAASPDAPYFWQSEKDGKTDGKITILVNEHVLWKNADTDPHTVTSGTVEGGVDGKFDSGLFGPGKSFKHQFTEVGTYDYYCLVHPWMTGVVTVKSGMQVLPNVGSKVGDGKTTFDVEYQFNRVISSANIDVGQNSITFQIVGKPSGEDNHLTLMLPKNLVKGPLVVWVDGKQISNFELTAEGGINKLIIPLMQNSELVTIVGSSVVPEFGALSMIILAIGVMSFIAITLKTQKNRIPNFK